MNELAIISMDRNMEDLMAKDRLARVRELHTQRTKIEEELQSIRAEIDAEREKEKAELDTLFGIVAPGRATKKGGVGKGGGVRKCKICVENGREDLATGHNARGHDKEMARLGLDKKGHKAA